MKLRCTCGALAAGADRHAITCQAVTTGCPHAMINDGGETFYPDTPQDAAEFEAAHGARPVDPARFAGWAAQWDMPP